MSDNMSVPAAKEQTEASSSSTVKVTTWHPVALLDQINPSDVTPFVVNQIDIAIYDVNGEYFASDNKCTHGAARLSDGFLEGNQIECPLHQGRFDVCHGKALCAPLTTDLRIYPLKVEGNVLLIALDTP